MSESQKQSRKDAGIEILLTAAALIGFPLLIVGQLLLVEVAPAVFLIGDS